MMGQERLKYVDKINRNIFVKTSKKELHKINNDHYKEGGKTKRKERKEEKKMKIKI